MFKVQLEVIRKSILGLVGRSNFEGNSSRLLEDPRVGEELGGRAQEEREREHQLLCK